MATDKRLGRGLESLLSQTAEDTAAPESTPSGGAVELPLSAIRPNPMQPRSGFEAREMEDLVESIRSVGILQPLIVRRKGDSYELIAGERRFRAAQMLGLKSVPVVERATTDDEMLTLALVENLQREDLNPIEKGKGFKELIERFDLTQEEASKRIGKDRSTIANFIRLLELPESVQHVVSRGTISMGHARALLGLKHASTQQALALRIEEEGISVREVERIVSQAGPKPKRSKPATPKKSPHIRDLEDRIREHFGAKVNIDRNGRRGKITIHFYSDDDLQRILDVLGLSS